MDKRNSSRSNLLQMEDFPNTAIHLDGEGENLSIDREKGKISLAHLRDLPKGMGEGLLEALGNNWPLMPFCSSSPTRRLPSFMMKRGWDASLDNVMFYPGSFNPWHQGHRFCLEAGMKKIPHFHFVVVPDHNPWKKTLFSRCLWEHFWEICQKTEDLPCCVYPGLWGSKKTNHTVDWIPLVKVKNKGLMVGGDNFLHLSQWKDSLSLMNSLHVLLAVSRTEHFDDLLRKKREYQKICPSLKIILVKDNPVARLSSSSLR